MNTPNKIASFFDYFNSSLTHEVLVNEFKNWNMKKNYINEMRFGEYICNRFLVKGRQCGEIFYEENDDIACWKISETIGY
jgi:hypothetical protein